MFLLHISQAYSLHDIQLGSNMLWDWPRLPNIRSYFHLQNQNHGVEASRSYVILKFLNSLMNCCCNFMFIVLLLVVEVISKTCKVLDMDLYQPLQEKTLQSAWT